MFGGIERSINSIDSRLRNTSNMNVDMSYWPRCVDGGGIPVSSGIGVLTLDYIQSGSCMDASKI
jgi:hypothetical protein